jgi:metal-responsive CopG/Arc/MetJ family transcriptional regulator
VKTTKIQISIPPNLRDEFDASVVKPNYSDRSTEIRRLMAERVNQTEKEATNDSG